MTSIPVLVLPGYGDSGDGHWQTLWEAERPNLRRVVQDDWLMPDVEEWIAVLERAVVSCTEPPVLAAHSLACALVARWAVRSVVPVRGALLVAPSDVDSEDFTPDEVRTFAPMPLRPLAFDSIVVASDDDPFVSPERAEQFANAWGSRFVLVPGGGHLNADSGFGPWPEGLALLDELIE